jgi:hypothetical protein
LILGRLLLHHRQRRLLRAGPEHRHDEFGPKETLKNETKTLILSLRMAPSTNCRF